MSHPSTALRAWQLRMQTQQFCYRTPMKFGGRVVDDVTVTDVQCDVVNELGQQGVGLGSMTMGVAWAWPDASVDGDVKLDAVLRLTQLMIDVVHQHDEAGCHPLELCLQSSRHHHRLALQVAQEMRLPSAIPELAVLLAASPIEAALFDAHGKAADQSAYALLGRDHLRPDLGELLQRDDFANKHLSDFVTATPVASLPMFHLVGALDPLTADDVENPVGDGLPETLAEWITRNELTHLKIKLAGDDADWDRQRVLRIDSVATLTTDRGISTDQPWKYSLDFNERCPDEEYVLELLKGLRTERASAYERIQYIEQPTHRDLTRPDAVTMHRAAAEVPVVIDESLTGMESLEMAVEQGYSGIALKACKGHAEALLLGAVAQDRGLFLCTQDLTCVGASLLHSASLSAHLPTVAAIESNGRQYCPDGNAPWIEAYQPLFEIRGGQMPTAMLNGTGLGYSVGHQLERS